MENKPVFRVGAAGLDPRDWRLIEIVFKHSQYNKFEFRLVANLAEDPIDVLIVNSIEPEGLQALMRVRSSDRHIPVIAAVPRGAPSSAKHAISIERLTLQLLPILNRVVELELLPPEPAAAAPAPEPAGLGPAAVPVAGPPADALHASSGAGQGLRAAQTAAGAAQASAPSAARTASVTPAPVERTAGDRVGQAAVPGPAASQAGWTTVPAPAANAPEGAWTGRTGVPPPGATAGGAAGASPAKEAGATPVPRSSPAQPTPTPAPTATPTATASNLVAFPRSHLGEGANTPRLRVLVVDDSPTVRRQLAGALERLGVASEAFGSAAEALQRLAEQHFDLALLDVVMPDMDGYKLTREIKRNKQLRQLPVIILTSRSSPFDLARGALAGCDAYLTKPVPFRALEAAIVKQLRKSLAIDDLAGLIRPSTPPDASAGPARPPESRLARLFGR